MRQIASFFGHYMRQPDHLAADMLALARAIATGGFSGLAADLRSASAERRFAADIRRAAVRLPVPPPAVRSREASAGTIVVVLHDLGLGGAQAVAASFARWLLAHSAYDIRFVALRDGPFRRRFEAMAPVFCLADRTTERAHGRARRLRLWLGPDVRAVFVNSVASGRALKLLPVRLPAVAFIHELPKMLDRNRKSLRVILRRCTAIIGGSRAVSEALRDMFGADEGKLSTAHAFIEGDPVPVGAEGRRIARAALGIGEHEMLVCGCGVLHWRKSPGVFIGVAERVLRAAGRPVRFIWIGGGPDQPLCERRIRRAGIGASVRITGFEPDVNRVLRAADLFLLPSEEDPFPLAALQAALAGAPIVCFENAGGMPELVARGCGRVVPFGDEAAMAEAVLAYLAAPETCAEDGRRGRAIVQGEFTVDRIGPRLLAQIEAVAATGMRDAAE